MKHTITAALLVAFAAAGCTSGTKAGYEPERVDSVFDLRNAIESTGYECTDWRVVADPINATERAECSFNVTVAVHTNASQVQSSIEDIADLVTIVLIKDSVHLTGKNWSINCGDDKDLCEQFRNVLPGTVQVFTP